jgi:hemolysin III
VQEPYRGRFAYDRAELWADGIIHGLGVAFALAGVVALLAVFVPAHASDDLVPVLLYSAGLLAVLIISAVYNMWPISPVKWWLRRLDHSAIYVLIAGTYTPFLARLGDGPSVQVLIVGVWAAALAGIALKLALPGRFDRFSIALYLLIAWSGVAVWDRALQLPGTTLWLLAAGGLIYTSGVVFHLWHSLRFHNAIWHAFVLVAAVLHYGAVVSLLTTPVA